MNLGCLVCRSVESPSHSFRSYSVSSSDSDGRCSTMANCLNRKISVPRRVISNVPSATSKVMPHPIYPSNAGTTGPPRLVRSHAVRRDIVQDWNFDEFMGH